MLKRIILAFLKRNTTSFWSNYTSWKWNVMIVTTMVMTTDDKFLWLTLWNWFESYSQLEPLPEALGIAKILRTNYSQTLRCDSFKLTCTALWHYFTASVEIWQTKLNSYHSMRSVNIRSFSGLYFLAFVQNTVSLQRYSASLRI